MSDSFIFDVCRYKTYCHIASLPICMILSRYYGYGMSMVWVRRLYGHNGEDRLWLYIFVCRTCIWCMYILPCRISSNMHAPVEILWIWTVYGSVNVLKHESQEIIHKICKNITIAFNVTIVFPDLLLRSPWTTTYASTDLELWRKSAFDYKMLRILCSLTT